ncbi:hypothetical protein D081_1165 [Anaerovibrio sp. JC8]|uniref:hypothetical protein n=1 Tax=Anaerovibrio sp. JC8 TaxID=1240085 RepID=UPI000A0995AD|nr:hypothetical protein [Anaerovibrio sp. JC8]ORU00071.1 hypothetical protein D081_1165 [Anaerovibrio sp. JC8]
MVNYEEYYALGEQIHDTLIEIRGLENEMIELNKMLDSISHKLGAVDLFNMTVKQ